MTHLNGRMAHTDAQIIQRVLGGDTEAFGLLMQRYETQVHGLAAKLTGDPDAAADVAEEAIVKAYTNLRNFRAEADFGSWLYRITYNATMIHLGHQRKITTLPIDDKMADCISDNDVSAALDDMTEQNIFRLEKALTRLSPEDRTAITLFYYDNLPTRDIAYVLGTTISNVTTRLSRARRRLYLLMTSNA